MNKRVIYFLMVVLVAMCIILPVLAIEPARNADMPMAVNEVTPDAVNSMAPPEADEEPEPVYFVFLDGIPQPVEYELRDGITYITVSSFVAMADPQAVVEEEDGVVTVSSARVEQVADAEGNTVDVVRETLSMTVSTQVSYMVANDRYLYAKDGMITVNDRVAAPARMLAQVFNLDIGYDAAADTVMLAHVEGRGAYLQSGGSYYDADALYWLSHIINAESGDQNLAGKIAVGNVVMNRVNSSDFPNTIYEVLHQKNQFSPVANGTIKGKPNDESVVAAKLVLDGAEVTPTALFFNMKGMASYASKYHIYVTTIGDHDFFI